MYLARIPCWALAFLPMPAGVLAQDSGGAGTEPPHGLLPLVDYAGGWNERPFLSGTWSGERTRLAERGFSADFAFTQVAQGIVDGGLEQAWRYGGKLDALFNMDLDRLELVPGGLITMRTESRYGESVNPIAGTLLPVNDVLYFPLTEPQDEDIGLTITELRYTQFLSPHFGLWAGKFTTLGKDYNEFAGGRGDTQFLNHTFLSASVTARFNPYSTLGAGLVAPLDEHWMVTSSVYGATDSSTSSGFDDMDEGLVWSTAVSTQYRLGGLPGGQMITGQYAFDDQFLEFDGSFVGAGGITLPQTSSSWVAFWNAWQYLDVETPSDKPINVTDGRTDLQGWGLFARAGAADPDTNPAEWVLSGGVAAKGLFATRADDTCGLGYGFTQINDALLIGGSPLRETSHRVEGYYQFALAPSTTLTLDAQYNEPIELSVQASTILGLRLRIQI